MGTLTKSVTPLTKEAQECFDGKENSNIYSSPMWYAAELGRYFQKAGKSYPKDVRMGRGYSIHANDMLFKIEGSGKDISFDRQK